MRKITMLLVFLLFAGLQVVLAQKTITGTVTGSADNQPLAGVTVLLKGSTTGSLTDLDGKYSIPIPNNQAVLTFSFIGFTTQDVTVGTQTVVNVTLAEALMQMNEVVVTALGIKREAKSIGYSATSIDTKNITNSTQVNVGSNLLGKVAGLNVSAPPTGPGGSSKIRIRGQSSFGGDNSPLIVVNGIPINNSATTGGGRSDLGDGLQSINPDDIESMTVLKGASAAALYGFRAKDGVIIITTKTGVKKTGLGIEFNTSIVADKAIDFTDFQYEYGQGEFGVRPVTLAQARSTGGHSFGTKMDGLPYVAIDGLEHLYLPSKDRTAFYQTAMNFTNSVALSNGNENGSFHFSASNTDASAIVPNSKFNKKILDLGVNYKFGEKLTAQVNLNYSIEDNINPVTASQVYGVANSLYTMANTIDMRWMKDVWADPVTGNEIPTQRLVDRTNPYWTINKRHEERVRNRLYGNVLLKYQITPWLYAQGRVGQDYFTANYNVNSPTGAANLAAAVTGFNGSYTETRSDFREVNMDFLFGANKKFGSIALSATFGGNSMDQTSSNLSTSVTNFYIRDLYTIGNGQTKTPTTGFSEKKVNSMYGTFDVSYKDYLFVNLTGRNDWFSTLNPNSNSYLYPSVSTSFLFSQAFASIMPSWMNMGKLRVAYAEVGGDTNPYTNTLYYSLNANQFNGLAYGGINGSTSPNPDLKPLKVKEAEVGLEMILFDRRISLDVAAYRKNTVDEILNVDISNTSGYSTKKVNVGRLRNQGIETLLTLVPVRTQNFSWESSFNYTYNISKVLQLAEGQTRLDVSAGQEWIGKISEEVGMPLGSLRGTTYVRNAAGQIVTSGGRFSADPVQVTYGSVVPKHTGGWLNTLTYKSFRLFAQIDFKAGHKLVSQSNYNFLREGLHKGSLVGREGGVIFDGVNADGTPNTTPVEAESFYTDYSGKKLYDPFIFDASFIKFRTLTFGVDLTKYVSKTIIRGLNVNASINNFFVIMSHVDNLDPECVSNVDDTSAGIEQMAPPTTRSYALSINFKF
jgi:TonB-linked SusC/RagA family outer membrane protein